MAQFVLVPGGWHGGWCYARVAKLLRAHGHDVFTPTLTGLGDRRHLAHTSITLSTHVEDILNLVEFEGLDQFVLLGHSYSGIVITAVASELGDRIRSLFYLDAFLPENGQNLMDLIAEDMRESFFRGADKGWVPSLPASVLVNEDDQAMVDALCTPQPLLTFCEPVRLSGRELEVPQRTYLMCEGNAIQMPTWEKVSVDPSWKTLTIESMHDVMLDRPEDLAKILLEEVA